MDTCKTAEQAGKMGMTVGVTGHKIMWSVVPALKTKYIPRFQAVVITEGARIIVTASTPSNLDAVVNEIEEQTIATGADFPPYYIGGFHFSYSPSQRGELMYVSYRELP